MDDTCLRRNGSISTCFRMEGTCQASVTRPLSPECNQPSLSMAPAVFPSISFTWAAPRFAWAKYLGSGMGIWHISKNVILNLQPMDVVLSCRFLSKERTCWQVCAFVPLYSRLIETLLRHNDWDPYRVAVHPRYPIMIPEQGGCGWSKASRYKCLNSKWHEVGYALKTIIYCFSAGDLPSATDVFSIPKLHNPPRTALKTVWCKLWL